MARKKQSIDVLTVGSSLRDIMFYTDEVSVLKNPKNDPTREKLMCVEFGAKLRSDNVYFGYGGGAGNTAVNFAGLGLHAAIAAGIGADDDGAAMQAYLEGRGVHTAFLQKSKKHQTGLSFMLVDEKTADRTIHIYYGASADLSLTTAQVQRLAPKWVYVSSLPGKNWRSIMKSVVASDAQLAWNPGGTQLAAGYLTLKKYITRTNVLLLNRDEAAELAVSHPEVQEVPPTIRGLAQLVCGFGPETAVITDGRKGTAVMSAGEYHFMPTPKDTPVSVVGAGDCYGSSFVAGLIRYKGDVSKSMQLAQRNATAVIHAVGAQHGLLRWKDLPKSLRA